MMNKILKTIRKRKRHCVNYDTEIQIFETAKN